MAIKRTTNHPVVGLVEWETSQLTSGNPITLLGTFASQVTTITVPQLVGVLDRRTDELAAAGAKFDGKLKVFKPAQAQLLAAFAEVEQEGLQKRLTSCAGGFFPRLQKKPGGGFMDKPSNHSFGISFDINNEFNPQGVKPPAIGKPGSLRELVPIFEKFGFRWGGNFSTPDGMHFEVKKLLAEDELMVPRAVEIRVNGLKVSVPALLIEETTWIGVRTALSVLDTTETDGPDTVVSAAGPATDQTFVVRVKDELHTLRGIRLGNVGYVRFGELQPLYHVPFKFTGGTAPRLDITV
jgi:hypothetical protein